MPADDTITDLDTALRALEAARAQAVADERRRAAQDQEIAQLRAELDAFMSAASHDLQEPLRKIETFGERLENRCGRDLDDSGRLYLDRMVDAAVRMRELISDLLALARIDDAHTDPERVNLEHVVEGGRDDRTAELSALSARLESEGLPEITADRVQMETLFSTLVGNALKYRSPDRDPHIAISAADRGDTVEIVVRDNGIGFDNKHAERIFGLLERLHSRGAYPGTGVGLSLCRKIVERHGGQITARGEAGAGAEFRMILPIHPENLS